MQMLDAASFNIDTSTLKRRDVVHAYMTSLYRKYGNDLGTVCSKVAEILHRMRAQGHFADFSDREGELLYLLIRELQPDVVVEISPGHGYSTNYIVAALTDNRKGTCYSYEIQEEFRGRAIEEVIYSNVHPSFEKAHLEIIVGDATKADIPSCDLLFLDSNHEAYFAAWYSHRLLARTKLAFVHDILISDSTFNSLVPKAAFLGVREQYYLLQALGQVHGRVFSVAEFASQVDGERLPGLMPRSGSGDRSIVFRGLVSTDPLRELHDYQLLLWDVEKKIVFGDRDQALASIEYIETSSAPLLSKLQAHNLRARMGYRWPIHRRMFPDIVLDRSALTLSEFVASLEAALNSCNFSYLEDLLRSAARSQINVGTRRHIVTHYAALGSRQDSHPRGAGRLGEFQQVVRKFARFFPWH